ncbi:MAG: diguanylate cyclase [Gaiellaceae bacterium]
MRQFAARDLLSEAQETNETKENGRPEALVESYRRLAEVYHQVLSAQSLDTLLERIADTLSDLMPYEALHVYEANDERRELVPVLARSDLHHDEIMQSRPAFGEGITGWAVDNGRPVWTNRAHLDPRVVNVPGTPVEPEALITVPLIARGALKGALNIYRIGEEAVFYEHEFELAKWFGDAAALAIDNAQVKERLEHLAQTDSLTGLYNHRFFHERLRAELTRASRSHDPVALLMFDLDDFKRVNDIYGHGAGDHLLLQISRLALETVRGSDVVCRVGGEEFGVIMPSCDAGDAVGLAARLTERLKEVEFDPAGHVTISIGISQGPRHAMNPRELIACAEAAMMTAKARGKDRTVVFDDGETERPQPGSGRDVRSIAHLKMLQSLAGKLNRLNNVQQIGATIAKELRLLIDYHNCRVSLRDGDDLRPIAFVGDHDKELENAADAYATKVGVGITGRVAETGESLLVPNALECEFAVKIPGTHDLEESLAVVPLRYGSRVTGVIVISKLGLNQFDEDDVRLLEVLAGHASVALENARLYEQQRLEAEAAKEAAEIANALLEASRELATAETPEDVLARSVEVTAHVLGAQRAVLWIEEETEPHDLLARASFGFAPDADPTGRLRHPSQVAHRWLESAEPFVLEPADLGAIEGVDAFGGRIVVAPLKLEHNRVGALTATTGERVLDDRQLRLLAGLAHQAKLAIESAENYMSLERTFVSTVAALANALEAKDDYTASHARWIRDMAMLVGRELKLDRDALKRLELGALFHDIGKIGVPTEILQKPGPLNDEELEIVKEHPALGEKILAPIDRLEDVRPIVRACHERWDGGGYPDGKAGDDIPVEARVVLVCDAFHAMVTDRPYRARLPQTEAVQQLLAASGSQFDPTAVAAFVRLHEAGAVLPLD